MTALAADLLHALRAAGYMVGLKGDRLVLKPPSSGMSPALRKRIADHRDELKTLLRSSDPFADCTRCDPLLVNVEAKRCTLEHHATLVVTYLDRFAATGRAVDVEIVAWFAAALEEQLRVGECRSDMLPFYGPGPARDFALQRS